MKSEPVRSPRLDQTDQYYGYHIHDPYRWLEDDVRESLPVRSWVEAQNKQTFAYLEQLPNRSAIEDRLTRLWNYEKYGVPFKRGQHYYYFKNDGLQNHAVVYQQERLGGESKVLFDPNTWSEEGTRALAGLAFSKDGKIVAYGIQDSGSDWRTYKFRDIESGKDLTDELRYLKFTSLSWDAKGLGVYYSKYPDPKPEQQFQSLNQEMKLMYHRLGTPQSDDKVVYFQPERPEWGYSAEVSDTGDYLVITVWVGTDSRYRILYQDLAKEGADIVELIDNFENDFSFIDNIGNRFFFRTDKDAPKGRLIAIDLDRPKQADWIEIIPEKKAPLVGVDIVDNRIVAEYLKDVATEVQIVDLEGQLIRKVALPGLGTASGFAGKRTDKETFYAYQSYAVPPSIYRYDMSTGESELLFRSTVDFEPTAYRTERVFYSSKDGTKVPLFLTYQGDLRQGTRPTLLYGYGGFDISLPPRFSVSRLAWMEMGGVYAVANIRGGGEYGKAWHEGGKKQNKQNVFDDFIGAAEFMVRESMTTPAQLGIMGGSNGGLLVGACMTQRPDLFGAAIPAVGVMDMLRFDEFTAGRFWVDDYGSSKDSLSMFRYLLAYSPYHNLQPGVSYPATMVTTADTDDRVVPGHSFKFAAALQYANQGPNPMLIRIQTGAGHGSGKPTSMLIEEQSDILAFLGKNLGL